MGIYIFQPETACHNSDSPIFKLISSATTAELLVLLCYCTQLQLRYSQIRLLKKRAITKMSQRHLPMKSRQTNSETKYTRRPILPEIESVNLPLAEFHSSISAVAVLDKNATFLFIFINICIFIKLKKLHVGQFFLLVFLKFRNL